MNFHAPSHPEFWIFWVTMLACFLTGFLPTQARRADAADGRQCP